MKKIRQRADDEENRKEEEAASKDDLKNEVEIQTRGQPICSKVQAFGDGSFARGKIFYFISETLS